MDRRATKDPYEREQDEAKRLVRKSPKIKPPRRDSRRERIQEPDPDLDAKDRDLSRNFKDVGGSLVERVAGRFMAAAKSDMIRVRRKEDGRIVNISQDTLREEPGKYEVPKEEESPPTQDSPGVAKPEEDKEKAPKEEATDKGELKKQLEELSSAPGGAWQAWAESPLGYGKKWEEVLGDIDTWSGQDLAKLKEEIAEFKKYEGAAAQVAQLPPKALHSVLSLQEKLPPDMDDPAWSEPASKFVPELADVFQGSAADAVKMLTYHENTLLRELPYEEVAERNQQLDQELAKGTDALKKRLKGKDKKRTTRAIELLTDPHHPMHMVADSAKLTDELKEIFGVDTFGKARQLAKAVTGEPAEAPKSKPESKEEAPKSAPSSSKPGKKPAPKEESKPKSEGGGEKTTGKKVLERYHQHKKDFQEFAKALPTTRGEGDGLKFHDPKMKKMVPFEELSPKEQAKLMDRFTQRETSRLHGGALHAKIDSDTLNALVDTFSSEDAKSDLAKKIKDLRKSEKTDEEALQVERLLPQLKGKLPKGLHSVADLRRAVEARPDLFTKAQVQEPAPAQPAEGEKAPPAAAPGEAPAQGTPGTPEPSSSKKPPRPKNIPTNESLARRKFNPEEQANITTRILMGLPQLDRTPETRRALLQFQSLHPDDIEDAFETYQALRNKKSTASLDDIVSSAKTFYTENPSTVAPPETWRDVDGVDKPFLELPPEIQAIALARHQAQTLAMSLAVRERIGKALVKNGAPPELAASMSRVLLNPKEDPDEARREAGRAFEDVIERQSTHRVTSSEAKKLLKTLKDKPNARVVAVGHLQGADYLNAMDHLFDVVKLNERQTPERIANALKSMSKELEERDEDLYGEDSQFNVAANVRSRVIRQLDQLAPEKGAAVRELLYEYEKGEAERRSQRLNPKKGDGPYRSSEGGASGQETRHETSLDAQLRRRGLDGDKFASAYSSYRPRRSMGPNASNRTAIYHGVDPYEGSKPYAAWSQAHQRDLTEADFSLILKSARSWLKTPVLAKNVEGVVRDTQLRAALDLAVRSCEGGRYDGALAPPVYEELLRRLAGVRGEGTLLTVASEDDGSGHSASSPYGGRLVEAVVAAEKPVPEEKGSTMKASLELRSYAAKIASENPDIAYDLIDISSRLAAEEGQDEGQQKQAQDEGQKTEDQGQEKQAQEQGADEQQQKQAAAYRQVRTEVIKMASQHPQFRQALLPVLQILKQVR